MQGASRKRNRWDRGYEVGPEQPPPENLLEDQAIASLLAATSTSDPNTNLNTHHHRSESKKSNRPYATTSQAHSSTNHKSRHDPSLSTTTSTQSMYDAKEDNHTTQEEKIKPSFALSGALAKDEKTGNVYNGVVLKFVEPPEARAPNTRWRLYVFKKSREIPVDDNKPNPDPSKDAQFLEVLHIHKQSAYLFGREKKVADIFVEHPSLSKQHAVLQFRALPDKNDPELKVRCKPYLMDLNSTNGTFINGVRLDDARYYELRKGDVITLGASTREYVLLTENSTHL